MSTRPALSPRAFLAFASLLVLASSGSAHGAAYDGFEYPTGPVVNNSLSGGSGFVAPWGNGGTSSAIVAGSLSDPTGTLLTSGNHVRGVQDYGLVRYLADRPASGEYWVSFLMRRESTPAGFSGLLLTTANAGGTFFAGEPGSHDGDGALVISNGNDPQQVSTGVPFEANRDYFLVTRFEIGDGNDAATLWVNPTPGVVPTTGGTTFSLSNFGTSVPQVQLIAGVGPGVVTHFDEFRAGTSYLEVAPVAPEPGAVGAATIIFLYAIGRRRRME